jgi:hypothetical protein
MSYLAAHATQGYPASRKLGSDDWNRGEVRFRRLGSRSEGLLLFSPRQDRFQPFDFESPEFSRTGPLLRRFAVGRVVCLHREPAAFVLAGSPECGLKRGIVLLSGSGHLY